MTEQSKLEWTEYKSRFRAVTAYGTYWVDMHAGSTSYQLICGTNPCCEMFSSPQDAKDYAQMIHERPSSRDNWFNLSDVEQAPYHAPLDLSELLRTYETLLADDNLPERVAVQTVDLRVLLKAAKHVDVAAVRGIDLLNEAKELAFTAIIRMRAAHVHCNDLTIQAETLVGNIDAAIRALPYLSSPCAVEVMKLEWTEHVNLWHCDKNPEYQITRWWLDEIRKQGACFEVLEIGERQFGTLEEAKAAAQTDFERRILSCIVTKDATLTNEGTKPVDVAAVREECAQAVENAMLSYNLTDCAGLSDWAAFEKGQESGLKFGAAAIRALSPAEPVPDTELPWRMSDIKRGLILFRTSNNAHGLTNFSMLTERVNNLPATAKTELANMMRNIAHGLHPAEPAQDEQLPQDVINLVIAAREVMYGGYINVMAEEINTFDKALEAFASRIPWDNEPDEEATAITEAGK